MKKGFTLAEIMIVLSVIAILTAILLPAARNAMPNEKVMKFKKGHEIFKNAVAELVTSDKYYLNGDLGTRVNGDLIDGFHEGDFTYFCESLADVINAKKVTCSVHGQTNSMVAASLNLENTKNFNDAACENLERNYCPFRYQLSNIILNDSIEFHITNSKATFGMPSNIDPEARMFSMTKKAPSSTANYKTICMDVDGLCKGEASFAFGLRVDGRIILSQRAQQWLKKSIQDKD